MRRLSASLGALFCALALPAGALAATPAKSSGAPKVQYVTGTVTDTSWSTLTIQTAGRRMGVINALTDTANAITKDDYTYVWGGGHAEAGVASVGIKGPGYNGRTRGYDCSGSVAAVLSGAGLWPAGAPVPNDAGVISELRSEHLIARGAGTPPNEVTLYDDPGVHIFMNIDGRFFGTSDGGGGGDSKGGAGWLDDGAPDAHDRAFKQYHVLPSVLKNRTIYGHSYTFQTTAADGLAEGAAIGNKVRVGYVTSGSGTMTLSTITYLNAATVTGTVTALGDNSFSIQTPAGATDTFATAGVTSLTSDLEIGDQVSVAYTSIDGAATAHTVTVTATPAPPTTTAPTPPVTDGWSGGQDGGYGYPGG